MPNIEKLIEATKLALAQALDEQLYLPIKEELRRADVTHSLGQKKEIFKDKMEEVLDNLKIELVRRGIVKEEGAQAKKYKVVFLAVKTELLPNPVLVTELQESDIPVSFQPWSREHDSRIVVLRPFAAEGKNNG